MCAYCKAAGTKGEKATIRINLHKKREEGVHTSATKIKSRKLTQGLNIPNKKCPTTVESEKGPEKVVNSS